MDSPLLLALRSRHLLRAGEEELLRRSDVLALTPKAQLAYLQQNRSVGLFVTLFGGGVRLLLIAGAPVGLVSVTLAGALPFSWWMPPVWIALGALSVWAAAGVVSAARSLSVKLPSYDSLRAELEPDRTEEDR